MTVCFECNGADVHKRGCTYVHRVTDDWLRDEELDMKFERFMTDSVRDRRKAWTFSVRGVLAPQPGNMSLLPMCVWEVFNPDGKLVESGYSRKARTAERRGRRAMRRAKRSE